MNTQNINLKVSAEGMTPEFLKAWIEMAIEQKINIMIVGEKATSKSMFLSQEGLLSDLSYNDLEELKSMISVTQEDINKDSEEFV